MLWGKMPGWKFLQLQTDFPRFTTKDWLRLSQIHNVLSKFNELTLFVSEKKPQISLPVPTEIQIRWTSFDSKKGPYRLQDERGKEESEYRGQERQQKCWAVTNGFSCGKMAEWAWRLGTVLAALLTYVHSWSWKNLLSFSSSSSSAPFSIR